jgi:hypothetical protein
MVQFNGDSGTNYDWVNIFATVSGSSPGKAGASGATAGSICSIGQNGAFSGGGKIYIPQYASTTFDKTATGQCGSSSASTTFQGGANYAMTWHSTAAITSITLTPSSGNFQIGDAVVIRGAN